MACLERGTDLAVGLEATDAGTVARPRVDDDKWPLCGVDFHTLGRDVSDQAVVDGPFQLAAVNERLELIIEDMGDRFGCRLWLGIATLPQDGRKQDGPVGR